ncbi:hypothetical protein NPX13_g6960 [Xylaria arbuscula]|uniref:Uncharacterized protein n=1 Tax=Xylaria arbuscula TaxID=114810 RepID=A0A9W8TLM9_9PEZI|nr:hypothetical protein NPX13_g6960 [Xylaria arbuscula]
MAPDDLGLDFILLWEKQDLANVLQIRYTVVRGDGTAAPGYKDGTKKDLQREMELAGANDYMHFRSSEVAQEAG